MGWLRNISHVSWWTLGSLQGHPGRSAGSLLPAPCSDHFQQLGRDRSPRGEAKSRLQGWVPKGGCKRGDRGCGGVSPSPPHLGLPHREEQSQHLGLVPTNPLTDTAQLQDTHTQALDHGQHSLEDADGGEVGGRRRWGSKLWPGTRQSHPRQQEPHRLWLRAGPAMPCPIPSCPSLQEVAPPRGHGGQRGPRQVKSPPPQNISPRAPQTAKRTEKCLEKRETPRKPQPRGRT